MKSSNNNNMGDPDVQECGGQKTKTKRFLVCIEIYGLLFFIFILFNINAFLKNKIITLTVRLLMRLISAGRHILNISRSGSNVGTYYM